jgi:hypothetical protein
VTPRRPWLVACGLAALVGGQIAWGATGGAQVSDDPRLDVLTPADGTTVPDGFVLSWRPIPGITKYAVLIDHGPPRRTRVIAPGDSTLVADGVTSMRLTIAPRTDSSPSLRDWHTLVPLTADAHRRGEQAATTHFRVTR